MSLMRALIVFLTIAAAFGAAGLALAGAVSIRADIFNIAWPLKVLAGLAILAVLLLVRAPAQRVGRLAAIACAAGLVLTGVPWPMLTSHGGLTGAEQAAPGFTVVTFNAWASNSDLDSAERWLRAAGADVIALQEIGLNTSELPQRLIDAYPFQHRCRWGVRLVSTHPFSLTGCSDQLPAAWARLVIDGREVTVTSVHLARPLSPSWYRVHSDALADLMASRSGLQVVMGDFNTGEGGFLMARQDNRLSPLIRVTRGLRTWPSGRLSPAPLLGIDHVWASEDFAVRSVMTGPHIGSDHRPVRVDFALRDDG